MEYFIELLIVFGLGLVLGWRASAVFYIGVLKSLLNELGVTNQQLIKVAKNAAASLGIEEQQQVQELESRIDAEGLERIEIKVEKHSETLYAFRKDNDQFLGQGASREQLIEAMGQRMKNVRLIVVEGDEYMKSEA